MFALVSSSNHFCFVIQSFCLYDIFICVMNSQVKALMEKLKENTNLLIGELCVICLLLFPGSLVFANLNLILK